VPDFFISYNSADRTWAEWIAWQLEEAGSSVLIQAWDFRPGSNFVVDMQRAAQESKRTIAVLSPNYLAARFTQPEWAAAFAQDPTGEQGLLVPVRVRECDPQGLWPQIVYVDLVGLGEPEARERLLAGIDPRRAKPTTPVPFPGPAARSMPERPRFPGELPRIWNVYRRNPNLTGRDALLASLHDALVSDHPAARRQAICGLGGVGKTQLAVEYAYRYASAYTLVWWVRADDAATLAADFAGLATELDPARLGLSEMGTIHQPAVVDAVRRWLEHNRNWLLIFDNARQPTDLRDYLPQRETGHVLITSRNRVWGNTAQFFGIKELEAEDAAEFLLRRTGQGDAEAARVLASELGQLPLALEQAGAYMEASGSSLAGYLQLFRTRQAQVLRRADPPADYPATVATAWELAFQEVRAASSEAADLLNLCAFLASEDIPHDLLSRGSQQLPEALSRIVSDAWLWNEAMKAVRQYSLLELVDDALRVHRLVQAVARDRLEPEARRDWAQVTVRIVKCAFPFDGDDVRTWPPCVRLLPHALAAAGHAEALAVDLVLSGALLKQVGLYLRARAHYSEARKALERTLAIEEATRQPDDPDVATTVNDLGRVQHDLGELAEAQTSFERALQIHQAALGPAHPTVARDLNDLGSVLLSRGRLDSAIEQLRHALAIDETVQGADHPDVARDVGNLGRALHASGDLHTGRRALERALRINEAHYGPYHPCVAADLSNLGLVLVDLEDLAGARACFERSLHIREQVLGADHPSTVRVRSRLASVG
jgi:tetratricopeptide (TPR) repeat protein